MTAATMTAFSPDTDPRAFRSALGRFATGVTVVTAIGAEGPIGMTANSFSSVSLLPALVLWSPAKASSRHDDFVAAGHFSINVLAADQVDIGMGFARAKDAFDTADTRMNEYGVPVIRGCIANFECTRAATHDAGDHTIIIGQVIRAQEHPGAPLIFADGQMGLSLSQATVRP